MKFLPYIIILILAFFLFKDCQNIPSEDPLKIDSLKAELKKAHEKKDSIRERVVLSEQTRTVYITKWRTLKDTIRIPAECDTIARVLINTCDSVLAKDSIYISELKSELRQDSIIIAGKDTLIKHQDLTIIDLRKEVKKQKKRKRIFAAIAAALGIIAVVR